MNKLIVLPFLFLILNFNAQKDFVNKYDIKNFVRNNIELIENLNPEKFKDRRKFEMKLLQHRINNSGIVANYFFEIRLMGELKNKMSDNINFIKIRNRNMISNGVLLIASLGSIGIMLQDPFLGLLFSVVIIYPIAIVLAIIPQIGKGKIRAQLLKDYFLSINTG
jgi:hypothetical protein